MLVRLKIENIAIIESADISFSGGFNVMTGETGAGKSIIIDSINAVTGERTSKELIRTGCEKGSVTAVFESVGEKVQDKLESMGIEREPTVILGRVIKTDGRNICTVLAVITVINDNNRKTVRNKLPHDKIKSRTVIIDWNNKPVCHNLFINHAERTRRIDFFRDVKISHRKGNSTFFHIMRQIKADY